MEQKDARGLTQAEAIARYQSKNHPRPALTADAALFRWVCGSIQVLLIRRAHHPYFGQWALPGGFAREGEAVRDTAARELAEETGVSGIPLHMVDVFSTPGRDPRGWVVSAAYWGVLSGSTRVSAGDDADAALWFTLTWEKDGMVLKNGDLVLRDLAFDHWQILHASLTKSALLQTN